MKQIFVLALALMTLSGCTAPGPQGTSGSAVLSASPTAAPTAVPTLAPAGKADPLPPEPPQPAPDAQTWVSGDYRYTLDEKGSAVLLKYLGSQAVLSVPDSLDGHPLTGIADGAFVIEDTLLLQSVTLPEGVENIGNRAFAGNMSLASIVLPESLLSIGGEAFAGNMSLAAITLPGSLVSIGDLAFRGCTILGAVALPDSLVRIGANPFVNSPGSALVSPDHPVFFVDPVGEKAGALYDKSEKRLVSFPNPGLRGSGRDYVQRSSYEVLGGTLIIGKNAFDTTSLPSLTLPEGLLEIGESAFRSSGSLSNIVIPQSVTLIGDQAFAGSNLKEITLPGSVKRIGIEAFSYCANLASVTLSEGLLSIGDRVFENIRALGPIMLPDSLEKIGVNPLRNSAVSFSVSTSNMRFSAKDGVLLDNEEHNLISYPIGNIQESYTVPEGILTIGEAAFYSSSLVTVHLSQRLTSIGDDAFYYNAKLASVNFPTGLESIGNDAFYSAESLKEIILPDSVKRIGEGAFSFCGSLVTVRLPEGLNHISNSLFNNSDSLAALTLPAGVTRIGDSAFAGCENLASIILPSGLKSIGDRAFEGCENLSNLLLPEGLESIGSYAFSGCHGLPSLLLPASLSALGSNPFKLHYSFNSERYQTTVIVSPENPRFFTEDDVLYDRQEKRLITYPFWAPGDSFSVPEEILIIGDSAFYDNNDLVSVTLPDGLKQIDSRAFDSSYKLTSLTLPAGLERIGEFAFSGIPNLVLRVYPGTFGEQWAAANYFKRELIGQ